jgi:hypothetical protein
MFVMDGDPKRICNRCKERRPLDEFTPRLDRPGQRDTYCRACRSAYGKAHYAANKQRYIDLAAARRRVIYRKRTEWLIEYFRSHPCVECGEGDPVVLEFDHLRDKLFDVGNMISDRNWDSILAEIEKCEVVCANCHRRRTAIRRGALRAVLTMSPSDE